MKRKTRRLLLVIGIVLLVMGIASLFVPIPQERQHGFSIGELELGVTQEVSEPVDPAISAAFIVAGIIGIVIGVRR